MTAVLLCGLGVGLGLVGAVLGTLGSEPSLGLRIALLDRPLAETESGRTATTWYRPDRTLGRRGAAWLASRPHLVERLDSDLYVTGTSLEELAGQAVMALCCGVALPPLAAAILWSGGLRIPVGIPLAAAVLGAVGGLALPVLALRHDAKQRRAEGRRTVGTFLDLVVLCLAGGMGVEGALVQAADLGRDRMSERIRAALGRARDTGRTPWEVLGQLGERSHLSELVELAAAVGLAGTEGARIRSTLSSKAASIRRHELAREETEANTISERLFLPGALLLVGFLVFVGYPAFARISGGL